MKPKTLVIIGGILLMVGAATPWATLTSSFLGASRSITGIEGDGLLTAGGGAILFLIGLLAKEKPGQTFSGWGLLISIACGLLIGWKVLNLSTMKASESVSLSFGFGLICLSPLGALLSLVGSAMHIPAIPETVTPVIPSEKPAA